MKIRTMLGLATIGGLLYLHRKRGGEFTLDSFRDSARDLWRGVQAGAEKAKDEAMRGMQEAREQIGRAAHDVSEEISQQASTPSTGNGRMPR